MIFDYFVIAFNNLRHRKLRSWLTVLGIFIGVAAVVSLISLGQGMQNAINEQFEQLGANKITIQPGAVQMGPPGSTITAAKLTDHDLDIIKKIKGVDKVAGMLFKIGKIKYSKEVSYQFVTGIPLDESKKILEDTQSFKIKEGRDLKNGDKYKAIIGIGLAEGDVFDKKIKLRDKVEIEDQEFKVIGILEKIGNPYDDNSLIIPLETAREIFNTEELSMIIVQIKETETPSIVAENIKEKIRKDRNQEEGEEDFRVATSEQLIESFTRIFLIVQVVLVGIAAISLLVGGIGIMNTMYTSVLERTREIGIMKAIGAKNSSVMLLFLIESGLIGLAGGAIGLALGIFLSKTVESLATNVWGISLLKAAFTPTLIFGALAFSFIIGCLSGTLPARAAAKLKPVDALRYE